MVRRRSLLATVMAVALLGTGLVGVAAQEATPAAATFADTMGLPELRVRITDTAYEGLPAETPAGRYLLTLEVEAAEGAGLNFMQLPEGMSFRRLHDDAGRTTRRLIRGGNGNAEGRGGTA